MKVPPGRRARLVAFQHRDFRLLWSGMLVSIIGSQMQFIAVNWHVYELLEGKTFTLDLLGHATRVDGQALGLGVVGLVRFVPIVGLALLGGILADTRDRRRMMIGAQVASCTFALTLAAITLTGHASLPALYLLTGALAAAAAFDNPARQSLVPNLVPRAHLANAVSLNTLVFQIASIVGPAIAGVLVARYNVGLVYGVNALSFLATLLALLAMDYRGGPADIGVRGLGSLMEGLRFVRRTPIIWSTMLLDFIATFFSSARTMLPIVAGQVLGVGPAGYGFLATAQSVGAVLAGVAVALRHEIHRQGMVLLASVAAYGVATALFGLSTSFALSYILFALTGAADTVSTVIRGTIRQMRTPDRLRGRMTSVNMVFFMGGPQLGEMEAGLVAALVGAPLAIFTGGLATVLATAWVAWKFPRLWHFTHEPELELPTPEGQPA